MFKKKKKNLDYNYMPPEETRFRIPQMDYGTIGFSKGRSGFRKSQAASPIHGSNVVDRNYYKDNSGQVNVDKHYDFIRDEKKISDEEIIAKYGTKYYEFQMVNKNKELYTGSNYNKKEEEKEKVLPKAMFSFIDEASSLDETEEKVNNVFESVDDVVKDEEEVNIYDENLAFDPNNFKLDVELSSDDEYEYNSYSKDMPQPKSTNIPSFLSETPRPSSKTEDEDLEIELDNLNIGDIPNLKAPDITFDEENYDENQEPLVKPQQETKEAYVGATANDEALYDEYEIDYKAYFSKSNSSDDEIPEWLSQKKEIINQSLMNFNIDGEVVNYTKGPAFTRYEILLAPGVNIKKINSIEDNLQAALQATSMRILAPIPGKNTIGIEVPNDVLSPVTFGDLLSDEFVNDKSNPLKIALGKDIDGKIVYENIANMPHVLIAGATQSGKSVSVNTMIMSLLIKNSPEDLKLILVDPKIVEFTFYEDLPHLITPIINEPIMACEALKWCVKEMDERYDTLKRARVKNIGDYHEARKTNKALKPMPYLVVVIDEFNELIMQSSSETNESIIRLAQKARAAGIHLLLVTQRPTSDVVNGTIKGNIVYRITFRVASRVDSMVIIDEPGAEALLGKGDMIIKGNQGPIRAQGAYLKDSEINAVCDHIRSLYEPNYVFTHEDLKKSSSKGQSGGKDASGEDSRLLYEIALACLHQGNCSINSIQGAFQVGFNRAQRIVNLLEELKVVSPKCGTKAREFLVDEYQLKQLFNIED